MSKQPQPTFEVRTLRVALFLILFAGVFVVASMYGEVSGEAFSTSILAFAVGVAGFATWETRKAK